MKHDLNLKVAISKESEYCVVRAIGESVDKLLTSFEDRDIELTDEELDKIDDIFYYLKEGVSEYEELKEKEERVERLEEVIRDAIYELENT